MLISRKKKALFVHIQKTGGSSLARLLKRGLPDLEIFLGAHDHAAWARDALGTEYDGYFKFAFVRNPWDRLVSWYVMIQQAAAARPRHRPNRLWEYARNRAANFEEFILNCTATIDDVDGRKSFCYNQLDYISDAQGSLIVDFVGRYEQFALDVRKVLKRLGVFALWVPHRRKSRRLHYSAYYSPRTRDVVAERYARDIQAFGYVFEPVAAPAAGQAAGLSDR